MKEKIHQYGKKATGFEYLRVLLRRAGFGLPPKGTTIGPVDYITVKAGPNRHERRKSMAVWRRFGEAAMKIAAARDISMNMALRIAMGGR